MLEASPAASQAQGLLADGVPAPGRGHGRDGAVCLVCHDERGAGTGLPDPRALHPGEVGEGRAQGLSLEDRLANVTEEINAHFAAMPLNKAGVPAPDAEYQDKTLKLLARKARIERSIAEGGDHPEPKGDKSETASA